MTVTCTIAQALPLMAAAAWGELAQSDELSAAMTSKEVLCGFRELPISFLPSYSRQKDQQVQPPGQSCPPGHLHCLRRCNAQRSHRRRRRLKHSRCLDHRLNWCRRLDSVMRSIQRRRAR